MAHSQDLGLGSAISSPSGVWGGAPADTILVLFRLEWKHLVRCKYPFHNNFDYSKIDFVHVTFTWNIINPGKFGNTRVHFDLPRYFSLFSHIYVWFYYIFLLLWSSWNCIFWKIKFYVYISNFNLSLICWSLTEKFSLGMRHSGGL